MFQAILSKKDKLTFRLRVRPNCNFFYFEDPIFPEFFHSFHLFFANFSYIYILGKNVIFSISSKKWSSIGKKKENKLVFHYTFQKIEGGSQTGMQKKCFTFF